MREVIIKSSILNRLCRVHLRGLLRMGLVALSQLGSYMIISQVSCLLLNILVPSSIEKAIENLMNL